MFPAMHYCRRIRMFASQRLAVLFKFTGSQISTAPWQCCCVVVNDTVESRVWHGPCRAASRAFAWPFLARLAEIKPGSAPGRAFFSFLKDGWTLLQWVQWLKHGCTTAAGQAEPPPSPGFAFSAATDTFLYLTLTFLLYSGEEQPIMH